MSAFNPGPSTAVTPNLYAPSNNSVLPPASIVTTGMQFNAFDPATGLNQAVPSSLLLGSTASTLPVRLPNWRNSLAKVRAGTGRGRILLIGDSTTAGAGSGASGSLNLVGAWAKSRTQSLAARLAALGVPTSSNSVVGDNSAQFVQGVNVSLYDPRIVLGANWTMNLALTCGGAMYSYSNGAVNNLAFTPTGQIDSATVYYITRPGQGTCTTNIDGGSSLGTINMNAASAMTSQTFTFAKGAHTFNVVPGNNGVLGITAIVTWDSTTPAIDILQAGMIGATATTFTSTTSGNPWDILPSISAYAANLTVIQLTINDSVTNTNLATYAANLQTIVNRAKLTGDVILESGYPSLGINAAAYVTQAQQVAANSAIPFLDVTYRWTDYATSNGLGWMFDSLHPNAVGYQDCGQFEASVLAVV